MINIFLCCNGRPLLGSHLNWWEVIQRQPGDCVIVDKHGWKFLISFCLPTRLYTGDKLLSLRPDQPELIGAEEIIFHPSPLLSLWITSCGWKNYTDQLQFLPLRQQNCNLTDFCIFLPVFTFFFCDKEPRSTISTQVAASICYVECYLDILSRRSENSASLILCILKFLAILQNFMGALKIDGSEAKYISDQICLLINSTYMNRQYLDGQKIIYDPVEIDKPKSNS